MIFKTIDDDSTLSGQRIVSTFEARKIAQDKLTASLKEQSAQLEIDRQELSLLEQKVKSGMTYEQAYAESIKKASDAAKEHAVSTKGVSGATDTFVAKQKKAQAELEATATSSKVAAVGVKALKLAFNMFSGLVISFAISKIIEGFQYLAESAECAKEKLENIRTDLTDNQSSYESNRKTLEGLRDEYDNLTKKADELGGVQNLTNEEYQRYTEIMSQILGITPKLITGWDDEGNAISNKNGLLQQSIDLLDKEYEKSLRNNTTKKKNEDVANGVITELNEFENSGDTKTASGTRYDLVWKDLEDYVDKAVAEGIDYTYKSTGVVAHNSAAVAYAINEFVYGDNLYKATELNTTYGWLGSLQERILSSEESLKQFTESLSDSENPIYQWFTDEQIDQLIEDSNAYFQELDRIQDDRETYYQKFKDSLNWNAQATTDDSGQNAYKQLSDESKSAITDYINNLDYASIKTSDDFLAMVNNVKLFTKTLASEDTFADYINDIYTPQGDEESVEDYSKRVNDAIANVQKYIKDNNLGISLDFITEDDPKGVQKTVDDLQNSYEKAIRTASTKFSGQSPVVNNSFMYDAEKKELEKFFEENSINTQEEIDKWNEIAASCDTAAEAEKKYLETSVSNKTVSFLDAFNSADFADSKQKLLDLAKSGELTSETLSSTEEYKTLLKNTGLDAEKTKDKIYDLLTAQEKLAGASNGINNLSSAYKEFEEKGFVTAQTIEALPDVFKKLESYDLFTKIIGNPKSGTDKIKQAFNQIVQEYLNYTKVFNSEDLYSDNVEIQQNAIETYIANLKSIGITNAEEVVNQTVNSVKQQRTLFNEAEQEYINYLNNKDGVTLEYIESTASKNSQLMQSFGEGYQDDYNNWIELLKKKQEAYQALVAALNGEYDPTESIVGNLLKNGKEVTASAIVAGEEARAAYERAMKKYEDYKNSFSLNYTPTNFDASYTSPDGSSSSSSKTDAYKQAFDDWYEALKHQLAMGQITEAQYYKELDKKNKEYFANKKEYLSEYRQYEEEVYKGLRSLQDNALSSIHKLIDLRKEMIKDIKQDEIDAINKVIEKEKKKLDAINESIDARKKAIELLKDEKDHEEEMADKNKSISDIQSKIDALKYDNSASAQKKRRELEEELTDAKKELADYISDYEYDKAVDALDKESDAAQEKYDKEEERLQNQIDKIEEYINNQKLLTQDALNDINGLNQSLFEKMKKWALDTKGEVYDVVDAWNEARKALELYNGVNRVPQVHDTLHKNAASQNGVTPIGNLGSKNTNKNNSNTSSGNSNNNSKSGYKAVHTIVKNDTLWVLAQKYYGDGTKWTKIQQANGNINPNYLPIGKKLYIPYKKGTKKVPENQLALTDELGEELILHANEKGTLRNLTKGSSVIPADITENLMSWGNFNPDMFIKNLTPTLPNITSVSNSKANTPAINIGDININGNMGNLTKSDLNNFRKEIVNDVYDNIQKNRVKNGRY